MNFRDAVQLSNKGVLLNVHVIPSSSCSKFPAGYNMWRKTIEIKVCEETKENKANIEIIQLIASFFRCSINNVCIVSGKKKREKSILLTNFDLQVVIQKLEGFFHGLSSNS